MSAGLRLAQRLQNGTRMTNKTKTQKKLRLNHETVRILNAADMGRVVGGLIRRDSDCDTCAERGC